MDKQYFVNVVNLETGKIFSLPTLYTDRTEACVCGQNYCRDRQVEDPSAELFFRVLVAKDGQVAPEDYLWDDQLEEEEDDFDWENPACQSSRRAENPSQTEAEKNTMDMVMALTDFICEHCTIND
jgi:hypothetical protein